MNSDLQLVYELCWRFVHALKRPLVQHQLLGIGIGLALGWSISQGLLILWSKRNPSSNSEHSQTKKQRFQRYTTDLLQFLLTPTLWLISVLIFQAGFRQWGWTAGLFSIAINILWIFLIYRIFLLFCFEVFPKEDVQRYRYQFFLPLFLLFLVNQILRLLTNIGQLSTVTVISLFDKPITLGAIFLVTVGAYLWIIGASLIEQVYLYCFALLNNKKPGAAQASSIILRYFLIGIGLVVLYGYIGFNPTALAAISGGLSVGIGFGLKEIIGNFISGIGLLFEGSLRPGDLVEVEGEPTTVERVSIRATTVKTFDNVEKIVPNQHFFTSTVTTYTGTDHWVRVLVPVGVSYQCDPENVIAILLKAAQQHPMVKTKPPPAVHLMGYGDSSVDFRLAAYIDLDKPDMPLTVKSDLYRAIWIALAENNIEIPFPQT
ncbi:MAG: mechanosensitive ion channel domain-containing protein, partial [Cyanobacteria bacterium P01_H01_bin.15]